MKNKIIIPLLLLHILGFAQEEKKSLPLIKYEWSTERLAGNDTNCERVVRSMFGFSLQTVKGAAEKSIQEWERHNKSVDHELRKRYGKNWEKDYNAHLVRCELEQFVNGMEQRGYRQLSDRQLKANDKIIAPQIQFDYNGFGFSEQGLDSLEVIADFIRKHPALLVEIGVHSAARGNEAHNLKMTKERAEEIKKALQFKFGLSSRSFSTKGYGAAVPLIPERIISKADHNLQERLFQWNTRIELVVKSVE